jgi:hypothetical protein
MNLPAIRLEPPTPTDSFFGAAESYLEGVRALIKAQPTPALALTLVAGHTLECALKAFLAKTGVSENELRRRKFGHNIAALWQEAENRGLPLQSPRPAWVDQLTRVYNQPFIARYPMGVHAIVLPNQVALSNGAEDVINTVRAAIR